jgi:hypothetical protein
MNDFEREMEQELRRILDPMTAGPIPARRALQPGGTMKKLLGGAGAAIGVKILTGIAVAAAATTFAVAATEVAITGSVNPANWGQQVTSQVEACKASAARLGVHGIGQCVASFARQHGDSVSDSHAKNDQSDKTKSNNGNGNGNGNANGHGNSSNNSNNSTGHGQGSSHRQGSHPTVEPNDPTGAAHTSIVPKP